MKKKMKKCDFSKIIYFNHNKKNHYVINYVKPKNKC